MPADRTMVRNVFIYDGASGVCLGGVRQNGSITETVFLWILNQILLVNNATLRVIARVSQREVFTTTNSLQPGDYDVYCNEPIALTDEPRVQRINSHSVSGREVAFREGIRSRDGKCVLSGVQNKNAIMNNWRSFEAAHIFPTEKESIWIADNFGRWITDMDHTTGISKITSCQNGFLLRADMHSLFDDYLISVNPDDGYRVVAFDMDNYDVDGRVLDPVCRDPADPHCVSDQLLRWHFRQSVLANMRGAGEPIFEHDFPPGTDMVKEIYEGPRGKERFELEIASRLMHS